MGLLHSVTTLGARTGMWELVSLGEQLAQELGVPLPPEVTRLVSALPDIAGAIGSGNPAALLALLPPELTGPLAGALNDPAVQALIRGDLEGAAASLTDYRGVLAGLDGALQEQLTAALGDLAGLQESRAALDGLLGVARNLPGALADATGMPVLGEALNLLAQASPEVTQVLRMAVNAADTLDTQISSALNLVQTVEGRLDSLSTLGGLANAALTALDAHIDGLDGLFDAARAVMGGR